MQGKSKEIITIPHLYKPYKHQIDLFAARDKGIRHLMTRWHRRCLAGDTPIAMADGSWRDIKDIAVGEKVLSYNNGRLEPKEVLEVFDNGVQEVTEYNDLVCTSNHKVLTVHDTYKEIKDTDHLINAGILKFGSVHDPDLAEEKIKKGDSYLAQTYDLTIVGNHNYIANGYIVHNSGKDLTFWNLLIREAIKRKGLYFYVFPMLNQGKKALFEGITNDGIDFMDFIPPQLRVGDPNATEMKVKLANGSLIQIIGTDKYDKVRGTNPVGVVYSEYAYQNPGCRSVIKPILAANNGWEAINSTPSGKNHMFKLENQITKRLDDSIPAEDRWFLSIKTIDDTIKHDGSPIITRERVFLEQEEEGYTDEFIKQEYWVSYEANAQGYYYLSYLNEAREQGRIGNFPWNPDLPVFTYWDIGVGDSTAIWFLQWQDKIPTLIDFYYNFSVGIDHYASQLLNGKRARYPYKRHVFPHDMINTEFGTGRTRIEIAEELFGRDRVTMGPKLGLDDGIQAVRSFLMKCRFDENENTEKGISALENYQREWNDERKEFSAKPKHDWACVAPDTLVRTTNGWKEIKRIKTGDYVYGYSLKERRIIPTLVTKSCYTRKNAKVLEVGLSNGRSITCTPDHKFLLISSEYKEAQELIINDELMPFFEVIDRKYNNMALPRVRYIRELETKLDTYDITVPETNNFVAEGVVIHNSHPADAFRYLAIDADSPKERPYLSKRLRDLRKKHGKKSWLLA